MTATVGSKFISSSSLARWLLLLRVALNNRQAGTPSLGGYSGSCEHSLDSRIWKAFSEGCPESYVFCKFQSSFALWFDCRSVHVDFTLWRIDTNRQMRCWTRANSHWILNTQIDRQLLEASKTSSVVLAHSMPKIFRELRSQTSSNWFRKFKKSKI